MQAISGGEKEASSEEEVDSWKSNQNNLLLDAIADEVGVGVEKIADFELNLYDVQRASLGGARSEFIHSARLDNLASCFMALESLILHVSSDLDSDEDIPLVVMFDHEEVGSQSASVRTPVIPYQIL
jgi:aspartyl aminopeptidase